MTYTIMDRNGNVLCRRKTERELSETLEALRIWWDRDTDDKVIVEGQDTNGDLYRLDPRRF